MELIWMCSALQKENNEGDLVWFKVREETNRR